MARPTHDTSILGPSTRVTGRVSGQGALRVEGHVRGDIHVSGETEISEGGSVEGNVNADALDVGGSLLGDAVIKGLVTIRSGAVVRGQLRGGEISIEPGSRVSLRLDADFELDFGSGKRR